MAKGGYLVKYGSSNENKGGQTIIQTKKEVDSFVKVLKEKGHNNIEIVEKNLFHKNSENPIEIAENKGDGKLINNLFNAYKLADTPQEMKKWETKVRNSSFMFERNLLKQRLSKVKFHESKISNDELDKFKNKLVSVIQRKHAWEMAKGGNVGDSGNITDSKSMYQGKRGFIEMDMGNEWIVKILDNGKEKSVTVRKSGFKVMDDDFAKGGYTEPSYDLPIRGKYKFVTKDGKEFILNVTRYERENDTEDSLVISQDQDELRDELGSIIIKNSAWRNLTKLGKTIMARASKGSTGKITKINDTLAKGGMSKGWSHKKK
jgi:hypothetical protein